MIIIKLAGGIGNQMFMAAYAKALQMRGYDVCLDVETFFEHDQIEYAKGKRIVLSNNELIHFNVDIPCIYPSKTIYKYLVKNKKLMEFMKKIGFYNYYDWANVEYSDKYLKEMVKIKDHSYIFGYFQNEKFFNKYKKEVMKMLAPKKNVDFGIEFKKRRNKNLPLVSIHFRRTDYKIEKYFDVTDLEYYKNAVEYLKERIGLFDICIFSDELKWVKKNVQFEGFNVLYAKDYKEYADYEELLLMSKCDHNIIANSTFSWWGAWLNDNQQKIVIAPRKWLNYRKVNIVPRDWVKL